MCLPLLVFICCSFAENSNAGERQPKLTLGLGSVISTNPYRGADRKILALPLLAYEGERFFVRSTTIGYHLVKQNNLTLSLLSSYRMAGYDSGDSNFLRGMADRDGTLEAGLQVFLPTSYGQLRATLLSDVLDEHNGHEAKLTFSKRFPLQRFFVSPFVSAIWQSSQLVNYYYGVRSVEASVVRPVYKPDSSVLVQLGVMANYLFREHWSISGQIAVTRLADEISNSPIVKDDLVTSAYIGIGYQF
ncbi:MAG: MipA/OmpV family protein [Pelovirga sp.]